MSVFISYSHNDEKIIERIAAYLVKANIHIWIDKWELNFGDSLIQKIQEAITESSVLLIMLSKSSTKSEWCKKELTAGLLRELEERRVVTIPVVLEDCNIPLFMRGRYYADFRNNFDQAIVRLQDSLLRFTDVSLNRVENDNYYIDWAVDQGIKDDCFEFNIDSVSFAKEREYSILCNINVRGNNVITDLYKRAATKRAGDILVDELLNSLVSMDKKNDFRIILEDNRAKKKKFGIGDEKLNYKFKVEIYVRRLGINNGFDIVFDFGSILRLISENREIILRK